MFLLLLLLLQAQLASSMWTASGFYHLLPWSCVVLESVPEAEVGPQGGRRTPGLHVLLPQRKHSLTVSSCGLMN